VTPIWNAGRLWCLVVIVSVALYDGATGFYLLFSPEPWLANGPETVWTAGAPTTSTSAETTAALMSMWRRLGAFSLFAGISTLMWAWRARNDDGTLLALLVTYVIAGLAFGYTDATWFAGTPYHLIKQAIGAVWISALVVQILRVRKIRLAAAGSTSA
jgi:hypothetical protein